MAMQLSIKVVEGAAYPWWGRAWRHNWTDNTKDVLVVPLCYVARLLWKVWLLSFRWRPTALEQEMAQAYQCGYEDGKAAISELHEGEINSSRLDGYHKAFEVLESQLNQRRWPAGYCEAFGVLEPGLDQRRHRTVAGT